MRITLWSAFRGVICAASVDRERDGTYTGLSAAACTLTRISPFLSLEGTGTSSAKASAFAGSPERTGRQVFCVAGIVEAGSLVVAAGVSDAIGGSVLSVCRSSFRVGAAKVLSTECGDEGAEQGIWRRGATLGPRRKEAGDCSGVDWLWFAFAFTCTYQVRVGALRYIPRLLAPVARRAYTTGVYAYERFAVRSTGERTRRPGRELSVDAPPWIGEYTAAKCERVPGVLCARLLLRTYE